MVEDIQIDDHNRGRLDVFNLKSDGWGFWVVPLLLEIVVGNGMLEVLSFVNSAPLYFHFPIYHH